VPVIALIALEGAAWVAAHVIEVAVVSAACGALSVAAVVALMRWQDRRQAAFAARGTLFVTRMDAAPLPRARHRAELPPVVNIYVADTGTAARVRQALPVTVTQLPPGGQHRETR
jgi:hypothetical protein